MVGERLERRLSAILAADVVGYSRLTGADEEGTHFQLQDHRSAINSPYYRFVKANDFNDAIAQKCYRSENRPITTITMMLYGYGLRLLGSQYREPASLYGLLPSRLPWPWRLSSRVLAP